jgi:HD-GYP domain-containing protein (c-di-GMP phosphodiesterase class II)
MVGHDSLKQSNLAVSTKEIILHHHEKRSGQGYPHGLDKNQLLPEVQIATLADIFDALTSARAYQSRRSRFEALDFIKTKLLATDVWPDAFKALVGCLSA